MCAYSFIYVHSMYICAYTHTHLRVHIHTPHMLGLEAYYVHLTITKYHVCRVHTHGTLSFSALRERRSFVLTKLHSSLVLTKLHSSNYTPQCRINIHCTLSPSAPTERGSSWCSLNNTHTQRAHTLHTLSLSSEREVVLGVHSPLSNTPRTMHSAHTLHPLSLCPYRCRK